jgi:2-deoxy-D-gluconate 3-dehydrogenase
MMETAARELGSLDILVNNAGVNVHKKALDITSEDFDLIIKVNSKGVYFCCQAAARVMIPAKRGKIINIASAAAFLVRAGIPNSVYAMTKAGIVMLTKALAEEWAQYNINVNAVAPGYFATPFVADRLKDPVASRSIIESTPLKRIGEPEDITGTVVFLSSDASSFITGQTICVDGGRTIL